MVEPPRRTLVRGTDPNDSSFSVTAILPDIPLCDGHAEAFAQGETAIGWCDKEACRQYGPAGESSPCGDAYEKLATGGRGRSSAKKRPSSE